MVERHLVTILPSKIPGETNKNRIKRSMTQSYSDSTDHVVAMDVGIRKTNLSLLRRGTRLLNTKNTATWHDVRVSALPQNKLVLMQLRKNATSIYVSWYKYQTPQRLSCQFLKLRRHLRHVMTGPQILCCNRSSKNTLRNTYEEGMPSIHGGSLKSRKWNSFLGHFCRMKNNKVAASNVYSITY
jgi:hypothetical protein